MTEEKCVCERESEVEGGRESKGCKREGVKWAVGASVHTWSYMFLEKETGCQDPWDQGGICMWERNGSNKAGVIWKGLRTGSETAIHRWPVWSVLSLRGHVQGYKAIEGQGQWAW